MCGTALDKTNRTREHVIPRWVQRRFDLAREEIHLLNGTTLEYAKMVIPCCKPCNHDHLAPLEEKVGAAVLAGSDAVRALDKWDLFYWLAKIYYGNLYRELTLKAVQSDPGSPMIMTESALEVYSLHHLLLQGRRAGVGVSVPDGYFPASIFVFECQELASAPKANWDYGDTFVQPYVAVRMGRVGIVAFLQDWGACEDQGPDVFAQAQGLALHPTQWRFLMGWGAAVATMYRRSSTQLLTRYEDRLTVLPPPPSMSGRGWFEPDMRATATMIAHVMGQDLDTVYNGEHLMNAVRQADGSPLFIPLDATNQHAHIALQPTGTRPSLM